MSVVGGALLVLPAVLVQLRQDDLEGGGVRRGGRVAVDDGLGVVGGEAEAEPVSVRSRREGVGRRFRPEDDERRLPLGILVRAGVVWEWTEALENLSNVQGWSNEITF